MDNCCTASDEWVRE